MKTWIRFVTRSLVLLAFVAPIAAWSAGAQERSPSQIVKACFNYSKHKNVPELLKLFSSKSGMSVDQAQRQMIPGFEGAEDIVIENESVTGTNATVKVSFRQRADAPGQRARMSFVLVREDNSWKIAATGP